MSEFVGIPKLGYKEAGNQQDARLGDEYSLPFAEINVAHDMLVNQNDARVRVKWVRNTSGGALVPGSIVKRDSTGDMLTDVDEAGAADIGCGIVDPTLQSNVADDEKFLIVTKGPTDVLSSAAITKGDALGTAASGKAVTNALDTVAKLSYAFGVQVEAATAADQLRRADVDFRSL